MVTFCIEEDKNKRLSEILSEIVFHFYKCENVESVFINSYIIHKPMGLDCLDPTPDKDGINISINVVLKDDVDPYSYDYREVKELLKKALEETHINLLIQTSNVSLWSREVERGQYNRSDYTLADGEILFDKNSMLMRKKYSLFFIDRKFENSVVFEPQLNLKKYYE